MASDDIMTAGAGGATATVRADIKAAFFDIDGTLTSFVTHVIPQSSIDALHELQDRGVKVFICSGRAPSHMTVVLDMMPVHFDGIIALNGQYCFDDHGLLEKESLLPEDIVTITRWLDEHPDVVANYCEKDYVYFNQITDAMQAAGMPDGRYTLCGEEVQMHGGVVRTASGGLAGSTLSVDAAVRNMVELTGVTPAEAIHMASLHPARMLGVDGVLGSLKPGKRASIVALDSGLHVQQIWIQGQLASF